MIAWILLSMAIGGMIGGATNRLAIAMLFRPYRPVRIGRWTMPLTPGLIPKRRKELARQLGRTVREYLINGEAFSRTFRNTELQKQTIYWAKQEWDRGWQTKRWFTWIQTFLEREKASLGLDRDICVGDWVSAEGARELRQKVSEWGAPAVNQFLVRYLESESGTQVVRGLYEDWTRTRGWVGRLTERVLDETRAAERATAWLIHVLNSPRGLNAVRALLNQALDTVFAWRIRDVLSWIEHLTNPSEHAFVVLERLIPYAMEQMADRADVWLDWLRIDRIVTEQVETFSLRKLEEMIVRVAKKELRLITWIGVLIGAIIGLIQGLLASFWW